jgi:hypothetical protein
MIDERQPYKSEIVKRRNAEDVFYNLKYIEIGIEIPRASVARLSGGKDSSIKRWLC